MLRLSSSDPARETFEEKFFRLVEDLLPKNTPIRPVCVCVCVNVKCTCTCAQCVCVRPSTRELRGERKTVDGERD